MAPESLSKHDIELGRAILLATDALNMRAEGAFWLFDNLEQTWRYFLVTSMFETMDSRKIYQYLNHSLSRIFPENEIDHLQLHIATPSEGFVKQLRHQICTSPHVAGLRDSAVEINDENTKVLIYRLSDELEEDLKTRARKSFRKSCKEIAKAA